MNSLDFIVFAKLVISSLRSQHELCKQLATGDHIARVAESGKTVESLEHIFESLVCADQIDSIDEHLKYLTKPRLLQKTEIANIIQASTSVSSDAMLVAR